MVSWTKEEIASYAAATGKAGVLILKQAETLPWIFVHLRQVSFALHVEGLLIMLLA
jgi:hypothetical protein